LTTSLASSSSSRPQPSPQLQRQLSALTSKKQGTRSNKRKEMSVQQLLLPTRSRRCRYSRVYLLYWYKGTNTATHAAQSLLSYLAPQVLGCTCFTSTRVQILTQKAYAAVSPHALPCATQQEAAAAYAVDPSPQPPRMSRPVSGGHALRVGGGLGGGASDDGPSFDALRNPTAASYLSGSTTAATAAPAYAQQGAVSVLVGNGTAATGAAAAAPPAYAQQQVSGVPYSYQAMPRDGGLSYPPPPAAPYQMEPAPRSHKILRKLKPLPKLNLCLNL
jgi:hypothetical protein